MAAIPGNKLISMPINQAMAPWGGFRSDYVPSEDPFNPMGAMFMGSSATHEPLVPALMKLLGQTQGGQGGKK